MRGLVDHCVGYLDRCVAPADLLDGFARDGIDQPGLPPGPVEGAVNGGLRKRLPGVGRVLAVKGRDLRPDEFTEASCCLTLA